MIDIDSLAQLARIKIDSGEKAELQNEFEAILNYVSQLEKVDTSEITNDDLGNIVDLKNITREDDENSHESDEFTEILLKEVPSVENRYIKVKDILGRG